MMIATDMRLDAAAVNQFHANLRGQLLTPDDEGYDAARHVWNAHVDRRPALIARCAGVSDVIAAVNFARDHDLLLAVRGGGHSDVSVCDGGLMLDLSPMRGIRVDPLSRTADVQAGATWHDLTHEAQAFGLAVPGGTVSDVGVAGLTLGGGFGPLGRKYGMTVDNVLSVDLVTADGSFLTASKTQHPDLFWGLRGGGGNFGVATSFRYQCHPVGPLVTAGLLLYPLAQAREALRFYRDIMANAPDELFIAVLFMTTPPAPFVPPALRGAPAMGFMVCHCGSLAEGEQTIARLRAFGSPGVAQIGPMPYTAVQHLADPGTPPGLQYHRSARHVDGLSDACIDAVVTQAERRSSPLTSMVVVPYGGAMVRVPMGTTATGPRDAAFAVEIVTAWTDPQDTARHMRWTAETWAALQPFARPDIAVNFLGDEGEAAIRAAYGAETYRRLVALKQKYDPTNLFRLNQNINPAG